MSPLFASKSRYMLACHAESDVSAGRFIKTCFEREDRPHTDLGLAEQKTRSKFRYLTFYELLVKPLIRRLDFL